MKSETNENTGNKSQIWSKAFWAYGYTCLSYNITNVARICESYHQSYRLSINRATYIYKFVNHIRKETETYTTTNKNTLRASILQVTNYNHKLPFLSEVKQHVNPQIPNLIPQFQNRTSPISQMPTRPPLRLSFWSKPGEKEREYDDSVNGHSSNPLKVS
jgi:hypothetical protein